jgi:hypothetical protein
MDIFEQSSQRLILGQRRVLMALVMTVYALLSLIFLLNGLLLQGVPRLYLLNPFELLAWFFWVLLAFGSTAIGVYIALSLWRGVTVTFDRADGTFCVRRSQGWRPAETHGSLYAIKRLALEENETARVIGLFLELRSGERLPLATIPSYATDSAQDLARTVREFLRPPASTP